MSEEKNFYVYSNVKCSQKKEKRQKANFAEKTELQLVYVSMKQIEEVMKEKNYDFNKVYSARELQNIVLTENFKAVDIVKKVAVADDTISVADILESLKVAKTLKLSSTEFLLKCKEHKISEKLLSECNEQIYALDKDKAKAKSFI